MSRSFHRSPPAAFLAAALLATASVAGAADVVINEIDYDQAGTDSAEFLELKNVAAFAVDLSEYTVELVNGTGGGAAVYLTIPLPAVNLAPGDYFVICANAATVANCDLDVSPDTNLIQNGAPDAAGLFRLGLLQDAVSWEGDTGAPYTEGSGVGLEDDGVDEGVGIARRPDGVDTDQNNADFQATPITPGAANDPPIAVEDEGWGGAKARYR